MKFIKGVVKVTGEHPTFDIPVTKEREGWIAEGTGLACTPIDEDHMVVYLHDCTHWVLTHMQSGRAIGPIFLPDKQFAHYWIEELQRVGFDGNWTQREVESQPELSAFVTVAWRRANERSASSQRKQHQQKADESVKQMSLFV